MARKEFSIGPKRMLQSESNYTFRGVVLGTVSLFLVTVAMTPLHADEATTLSVQDIERLAPAIEASEKNLFSNLRLESETWVEKKAPSSGKGETWERTPVCTSAEVWLEGRPHGNARVGIRKQVLEVRRDDSVDFVQQSYSVSFDGRSGRIVRNASGPLGNPLPAASAEIVPEYPTSLKHDLRYSAGAASSTKSQLYQPPGS
jgi:hypothetical protein